MSYLDWVERSWPVLTRLMKGHAVVYRATRGVIGHRIPGVPPMLLLDHVGAKSGAKRTTPLLYLQDGEDVVIVASKGGHPRHPAWFHNLQAHPDTTIQIGARCWPVHAHMADPQERERLWPQVVDMYGSYADYQRRASREIPLVILEPR
jgi:F420H(2)-dependent quinone reductase